MSQSATLTKIRIILASLAMGVAGFSAQPAMRRRQARKLIGALYPQPTDHPDNQAAQLS
jgi:hypothetical protein